jgi:hypothetical protein
MPLEVSSLTNRAVWFAKSYAFLVRLRLFTANAVQNPINEAHHKSYEAEMNKPLGDLHIVHFRKKDICKHDTIFV